MSLVIGLDIGTTSTIGILVDLPETIVAVTSRPVTFSARHPGWAEEDPEEWWANACSILQELSSHVVGRTSDLKGICVTGMLPAVILLDEAGQVLRPAIQQSDARCSAEVEEVAAEVDEEWFLRTTGNGVNQQIVATKLRWIEKHEPDVFRRIATVFGSYDYINWRLTGERVAEHNWALEAGFIDLATHAIDDRLVALAHVPRDAVPRKSVPHEVLGSIGRAVAAATGLPEGLPVFGGAADHMCSTLAAGIIARGDVLLKYGGSADIIIATDLLVPDARLYTDYHLIPGLYAPNGCMASGGSGLNWLVTVLAHERRQGETSHQALDRLAAAVPPGSEGLTCLPYFLGEKTPIHDPLARGTFTGLSLNHGSGHVWRSALEGFALAQLHHVEVLREIGHAPTRFFASDGGAKSRIWMQIQADILQAPIRLLENHHGSCVGAAWVAAVGAALGVTWQDITRLCGWGELIEPDPANAPAYQEAYGSYRSLYPALRPFFHRPAIIRG
ncbi:MAG TPA: FGGY family carbohydrate kinase [Geminicoccus sp.]|jgi:xylulokinase|uniref:FGGY-family carbohydrate kinase n=1 Tax=Geminicoccus sp. TaxID=2024832 RepID=UPI002E357AC4|nr:FGGY family carbohydrate kinase [Geminicoccus sp.]HEX2526069.1 FGGY family carbohydrate kinase [Geminicoccus sp.]